MFRKTSQDKTTGKPAKPRKSGDWRQTVKQKPSNRAVTGLARMRYFKLLLKTLAIAGVSVVLIAGIAYVVFLVRSHTSKLIPSTTGDPIADIVFTTDGVLTEEWFNRKIGVPDGVGIMDINIFDVKRELEGYRQVVEATITREFPDKVRVEVRELVPVLRARVAIGEDRAEHLLISEEGFIYRGYDYPPDVLSALPYIGGVKFKRDNSGEFKPVPGMEIVASLLSLVRENHPWLAETWSVVSCEHFNGDPLAPGAAIKVKSAYVKEIVFVPYRFEEQLDYLAETVKILIRNNSRPIDKIDLSLEGEAIVQRGAGD